MCDHNEPKLIPENNVAGLEEAFAKLAKRAAKLGMTPPVLVKGETVDVMYVAFANGIVHKVDNPDSYVAQLGSRIYYRRFVKCHVEGSAPVIDGWSLVSVIDHTTDSEVGNLIRNVPGKSTPIEFRTAQPICSHCNTLRRRNETFLLFKDGEYKQIGRNCLADFCRSPESAAQLVEYAAMVDAAFAAFGDADPDEPGQGGGYGGPSYYSLETVLKFTRCFVRQFGWVSRSKVEIEGGMSTASLVDARLNRHDWERYFPEIVEACKNMTDEDEQIAKESLAWILAKKDTPNELNDYLYNLLVVCSQPRVTAKHFGLACSLVQAYMRDKEMEVEQRLRKQRAAMSQHFGTVKKREDFVLTVTGMNYWEGDYGVTTFVRFLDQSGNVAIWKASGSIEMDIDATYSVKATVKEHSDYKGVKQTVLSRCKCEKIESPVSEESAVSV